MAQAFLKYCDVSSNPVLPLNYMGEIETLVIGNKICEAWMGPIGDMIYHFHEPYPEESDTPPMVGIPSTAYKKEIDSGFVFLFARATNPIWHPTIIYSVINQFKQSVFYLGNGPRTNLPNFQEIPTELKDLHEILKKKQGQEHSVSMKMGVNFSYRFMCKIALGFGHLFLHPSFFNSSSADLLRKGLWAKSEKDKENLEINGSGSWGGTKMEVLKGILKWPGGNVFALMLVNEKLVLFSNFFEHNCFVIEVTCEPELWKGKLNDGLVFVVSPQIKSFVGPISVAEFLAYKVVPPIPILDLINLEAELKKFGELPPYIV